MREFALTPQVLLVDHDPKIRLLFGETFEYAGCAVTTAIDGQIALHLLASDAFDVVVTDIYTGYVDGIQILKAAREQERPPAVIIMTSAQTLETVVEALRAGACDYVLKPCDPHDILERVKVAIQRRSADMLRLDAMNAIVQIASQFQEDEELAGFILN